MQNFLKPHVIVNLGGQPFKLQFDMNAIAEAEAVLDMPVISDANGDSALKRIADNRGNIRFLRGLLWAALLIHNPKITLKDAGNLITLKNMEEVVDGISKGLSLFFQSQGMELIEEATTHESAPTTGSGSGLTPADA